MDIKVRELNPIVVQTIDERAKKRGLSRQQYLKTLIENYVMQKELNETDHAYKTLIEKTPKPSIGSAIRCNDKTNGWKA